MLNLGDRVTVDDSDGKVIGVDRCSVLFRVRYQVEFEDGTSDWFKHSEVKVKEKYSYEG